MKQTSRKELSRKTPLCLLCKCRAHINVSSLCLTNLYCGSGDVRVAGAELILPGGHIRERLTHRVRVEVRVLRYSEPKDVITSDVTEKRQ